MVKRYTQVYNSGGIVQGSTETPLTPGVALVIGQIVGLRITVNAVGAGTLSSVPILYGLSELEIDDANQSPIMDLQNVNGTRHDIPVLSYVLSPRGTWTGDGPNVSTSTQSVSYLIYAPFALSRQPLYIKPTIAPYSVWGSSATGGTVSVSVDIITDDDYSGPVRTMGLKTLQLSLGVGDNILGDKLDKTAPILDLVAYTSAGDGALNYIDFRRGKEIELQKATAAYFSVEDEMLTISGHQSGLFNFRNTPFRADAGTYLDINAAAASTWILYEIEQFD